MPARGLIPALVWLVLAMPALGQQWPGAEWVVRSVDPALDAHVNSAFDGAAPAPLDGVRALLVVQGGEIVAERYREGFDASSRFLSWSMAKSFAHALAGIMVGEGRIALDTPLPVPEWQLVADDPRRAITLDDALRMSTGLAFDENYEALASSDAIRMLFGDGAGDMGHYAASQLLVYPPGSHWEYSSGTTNIVSRVIRDLAGGNEDAYRTFITRKLLEPIGIRDAVLEFDASGTLIASSLIFMSARNYARFGLLYLRDGEWNGQRILPEGWAQHARTPTAGSDGRYGAQWWLSGFADPRRVPHALHEFPADAFMAQGHQEQSIIVVPSHDLVVVCLSLINEEDVSALKDYLARIVELVPAPRVAAHLVGSKPD